MGSFVSFSHQGKTDHRLSVHPDGQPSQHTASVPAFMSALYKIQVREHARAPFRDYVDWSPCADCIAKLRDLFVQHPTWDLRVVDETKTVVTSTLDHAGPDGLRGVFFN